MEGSLRVTSKFSEPLQIEEASEDSVSQEESESIEEKPMRFEKPSIYTPSEKRTLEKPAEIDPLNSMGALFGRMGSLRERENSKDEGKPSDVPYTMTSFSEGIRKQADSTGNTKKLKAMLEDAFDDSEILEDEEHRQLLYLNCLVDLGRLPETEKMETYYTDSMPGPPIVKNQLSSCSKPTVFLMKKDDAIFGGYASQPWNRIGNFGNNKCFLFSITKDLRFVPFAKKNKQVFQWYQNDGMGWGATDLILNDDVYN